MRSDCDVLLIFVALLTRLTSAQQLAFTSPDIESFNRDYRGWHYILQGNNLTISWTTPFEKTTLIQFEYQNNGQWGWQILGLELPPSTTSYRWTAENLDSSQVVQGNKIYFSIQKNNNISCAGCVDRSKAFYVTNQKPVSSGSAIASSPLSSASPFVPSPSSSSATGVAGHHTSSRGAASTASARAASRSSRTTGTPSAAATGRQTENGRLTRDRHSNRLAIGLGVGLGVGLALLLILCVLLALFLRNRKREKRKSFNYRPTGSGNWTETDAQRPMSEVRMLEIPNRESGMTDGTTVAGLAAAGAGEKNRDAESSPRVSSPFARPSTSTSALSRKSWFEPFPFEQESQVAGAGPASSRLRQSTLVDEVDEAGDTVTTPAAVGATGGTLTGGTSRELAAPTADDAASSNYSAQEVFGVESPSDAAAVASPSSAVQPSDSRDDSRFKYAGVGPSSSPWRASSDDQPQQTGYISPRRSVGDTRYWPRA